jgi:hypothetical protein
MISLEYIFAFCEPREFIKEKIVLYKRDIKLNGAIKYDIL